MKRGHGVVRMTQAAAVALLSCSALASASDCAGGMDATGNACNGEPAAPRPGAVDSKLLYLKGVAMTAELRATKARQRQSEAGAEAKQAEANLKSAQRALSDAERAAQH